MRLRSLCLPRRESWVVSKTLGLLTTQNSELKTALALVCLLAGFFWTSFYGLNFGTHWDENRAKFDSVRDSLRNGLLLQGAALSPEGKEYNHGGLNYLLIWAGLTPEVLRFLIVGPHTLESLSRTINPILYTTTVRLRVRAIYVILSGLCIVWSFRLALVWAAAGWRHCWPLLFCRVRGNLHTIADG